MTRSLGAPLGPDSKLEALWASWLHPSPLLGAQASTSGALKPKVRPAMFDHVGPFFTMFDHVRPFLTIFDHFRQFWTISDHFWRVDHLWKCFTILDHFRQFWQFWNILTLFGPNLNFFGDLWYYAWFPRYCHVTLFVTDEQQELGILGVRWCGRRWWCGWWWWWGCSSQIYAVH